MENIVGIKQIMHIVLLDNCYKNKNKSSLLRCNVML